MAALADPGTEYGNAYGRALVLTGTKALFGNRRIWQLFCEQLEKKKEELGKSEMEEEKKMQIHRPKAYKISPNLTLCSCLKSMYPPMGAINKNRQG